MKTWMMIVVMVVGACVGGAVGQPAYTLEQAEGVGVLTVAGAEIVIVDGGGSGGGGGDGAGGGGAAELVQGMAIPAAGNGVGFAAGTDQVWRLAPGVYAVTAYAPAATPGAVRASVVWDITVDAPPPPPEPDRIQRIAAALAMWITVANEWNTLAPTNAEIRDALLVAYRWDSPLVTE